MSFNYKLADFISFKDKKACDKVRKISKKEINQTDNPNLNIQVIEDEKEFYAFFAIDIVDRIIKARNKGEKFIAIVPVGPVPQYTIAANMINSMGLSLDHVYFFNMDEYANELGITAPKSWDGSFQKAMEENFFCKINEKLRPPEKQIIFPSGDNIENYGNMIDDLGGANICYGGIGWCGHIAFWESHLGEDYIGNISEYKKQSAQIVELHPMTIMQNALHSFSGDWSKVPPKAVTIGPKEILEADHRSFWLDGYLGGGISWQRFIARLVLHGPISPLIPGSLLQTEKTDVTLLGGVADNVEVNMA